MSGNTIDTITLIRDKLKELVNVEWEEREGRREEMSGEEKEGERSRRGVVLAAVAVVV